jgi:hypothetical protein
LIFNCYPKTEACSFGLSATSQYYFSLRTNQPPATSQYYFSLTANQHQPSDTSQTNRLYMSKGVEIFELFFRYSSTHWHMHHLLSSCSFVASCTPRHRCSPLSVGGEKISIGTSAHAKPHTKQTSEEEEIGSRICSFVPFDSLSRKSQAIQRIRWHR